VSPALTRDEQLVQVFHAFARNATGDLHLHDVLRNLCAAAATLLDVDGAGVVHHADDRMRFLHASSPHVHAAERLQDEITQGPCHEAAATGEAVAETDLAARPDRWPRFAEHAVTLGLRAVVSLPLQARGRVWGALDLYRSTPGPFPRRDMETAQILADVAVGYVVMAHDRDTARIAHDHAAHTATHDPLTGLPNRALLRDRLDHALAAWRRRPEHLAVLFIDLDGFKTVNDTYGHLAGDQLLVDVTLRLTSVLRSEDTLARFGGDEFVILCEDLPAETELRDEAIQAILDRIDAVLGQPTPTGRPPANVTASIGVALADEHTNTPDSLLAAADAAMYRSKPAATGPNQPPRSARPAVDSR
jgi:diguanylate cyclase (GGDEF)-like protein